MTDTDAKDDVFQCFTCGEHDYTSDCAYSTLFHAAVCNGGKPDDVFPAVSEILREPPEEDEGEFEQQQLSRLRRVHNNLGHPSNLLLDNILRSAITPQNVIDIATMLACPVFARMANIRLARPTNPSRMCELGESFALDFSHHTTNTR